MAFSYDDLYNIRMDGFYKMLVKISDDIELMFIIADKHIIQIQSNNKNQCINESLKTDWHLIYMTMMHRYGYLETLKI